MTIVNEIKEKIEYCLKKLGGEDKCIIIYPYGDIGMQVKRILNECYGMQEAFIIDNHLCEFNPYIKSSSFLQEMDDDKYMIFIATLDGDLEKKIKDNLLEFWNADNMVSLIKEPLKIMKPQNENKLKTVKPNTKVGKYSYGPLCASHFVESVGAFCSFAAGCIAVPNHPMEYIATHPLMYGDKRVNESVLYEWDEHEGRSFYFKGVTPRAKCPKDNRVIIGNDVWLGQNVIITNGAKIGNGVVAGAGSVITKDIPDYAVVAGVPAKVIRYRYTPNEIEALNRIQWWNWTDEQIRERYDDLYLPIKEFIEKYDK